MNAAEREEALDEAIRKEALDEAIKRHDATEQGLRKQYINVLSYREVFHLSFMLYENVEHYLAEHPAIILDKEAFSLTSAASQALFDLYQHIGNLESNCDDTQAT